MLTLSHPEAKMSIHNDKVRSMITEQQRLARKHSIGGSDTAILMGLSSFKTPYQLFLEKKGLLESSQEESQYAYWGNKLEKVIRDEFAERNKVKIEEPDMMVHPLIDFMHANVDGYIPEWDAVLEVKCSNAFMASQWGESGSDIIPMPYLVQVAHYVSVMNAKCAHIAVLIGGNDYREYVYHRNLELEAMVIKACSDFWDAVQNDNAPPPYDDSDLKLMYPVSAPKKTVTINSLTRDELTKHIALAAEQKALKTAADKHAFNIKVQMQDAEALLDEQGIPLVTYKSAKNGSRRFIVKGVKDE